MRNRRRLTGSLQPPRDEQMFGIGLHTAPGVPWRRAVLAAATASTVYVLGASRLVR